MSRDRDRLPPGVYDAPITAAIDTALEAVAADLGDLEPLDPSDAPRALARLVHARLIHALAAHEHLPSSLPR